MTSGLTFLTVIALFLFGGPVLHGFSFALVCGIIVGTYSSVFIASPIVLFWHNYADKRRQTARAPAVAAATSGGSGRGRARRGRSSRIRPRAAQLIMRRRGRPKERKLLCLNKHSSTAERPRKPGRFWCRFLAQIVLIVVAVIIPMIYFDVLPNDAVDRVSWWRLRRRRLRLLLRPPLPRSKSSR